MILAANTSTSAFGLWAIVVIAVACLAFWLVMVVGWAARPDVKRLRQRWTSTPGGQETMTPPGPVMGGTHVAYGGRSVAPRRDAPAMATAGTWTGAWTGADGEPEATERGTAGAGHEPAVARDDMPTVPRPRESATDQPARSRKGDREP